MNNGQPKLRTQPPNKSSQQDALARLEKLSEWTEEPAKAQAAVVAEPNQPSRAGQGAYPWQNAMNGAEKQLNVKVPVELYLKLKWLGDTSYGVKMTHIVNQALQEKADQLLKERGIA